MRQVSNKEAPYITLAENKLWSERPSNFHLGTCDSLIRQITSFHTNSINSFSRANLKHCNFLFLTNLHSRPYFMIISSIIKINEFGIRLKKKKLGFKLLLCHIKKKKKKLLLCVNGIFVVLFYMWFESTPLLLSILNNNNNNNINMNYVTNIAAKGTPYQCLTIIRLFDYTCVQITLEFVWLYRIVF